MPRHADVEIMAIPSTTATSTQYMVQTPAGVLYSIQVNNAGSQLSYTKSLDGGLSWTNPVVINNASNNNSAVWYDRWSDIAAGLIHIAYCNDTTDTLFYRTIDTENSDALSAEITVVAAYTSAAMQNARMTIARSRGGNVYILTCVDAGVEGGFYRLPNANVPAGAWDAARTNNEALADGDNAILLPGWAADNQDMMCFFWDTSAGEVSRQLYDDSANTWAETSIATSMTANSTNYPNFAAAVDITNSQNILIAWSNFDSANADLRCWKVTESAITEMTNVVLNSTDDQGMCALAIEAVTNYWYAFYCGKSDGSETFVTAMNVYMKVSQDGGTTWGAETLVTPSGTTWSIRDLYTVPRFTGKWAVRRQVDPPSSMQDRSMVTVDVTQPRAQSLLGI